MGTLLLIDAFEFKGFEVPDSITLGGSHSLAIHKLPGGDKIIDSIGRDDAPLEWSGIFTGPEALNRAQFLEGYRVQGKMHKLTLGTSSYTIVIKEFRPRFERAWHIPYHIVCEVVADLSNPTTSLAPTKSLDSAITDQIVTSATVSAKLQPSLIANIAAAIKDVQAKVANVKAIFTEAMQGIASVVNLETAVITTIQGVITDALTTITGCEALINTAINLPGGLFADISGLLNLSSSSVGVQSAGSLASWNIDSTNLDTLRTISTSLAVAAKNLGYINGAPNAKQVQVVGGSLVNLALEYYGDATQWPVIAAANNMTGPVITGPQTILIPPAASASSNQSGGVDINHWIGSDVNLSSSNDLSAAMDKTKSQQRILRRLLTNPGDYVWHPTYGAGIMVHVGNPDSSLPIIEGLIKSQVPLEQGAISPTVTFDVADGDITANIQYVDQETNGLQFLSFTVSP